MSNIMPRILFLLCNLLLTVATMAQGNDDQPAMADTMRSNGKIFVVVAVLSVILLSVLFYLFRLDRKITKLEKENR
jgi:K+-transporting ATPase A subunit